jgi:DNA polymerase-3 subunit delta
VKLTGREAARYLAAPDADGAGALLFGADAMRVALKREALVAALIGPDGPAEMRLTRIAGADLRRDPAALGDAVRAVGFFPGPRVVLVDDAGDGVAKVFAAALEDWRPGDAVIVATAGALGAGSALRKTFEKARGAVSIGIYDDPPGRDEIAARLRAAGLTDVPAEAATDVEALAGSLDPGDFGQFVTKLGLYKRGDPTPLSPADIAACAPAETEADVDAVLNLAAEGNAAALVEEMRRVSGRGGSATSLMIAAARHFRALHAAACAADGPDAALARARPPVFGPRRTRMAAQARALGSGQLERALGWIMDTDLALRSGRPVPAMAMVERILVRIAMLRRN